MSSIIRDTLRFLKAVKKGRFRQYSHWEADETYTLQQKIIAIGKQEKAKTKTSKKQSHQTHPLNHTQVMKIACNKEKDRPSAAQLTESRVNQHQGEINPVSLPHPETARSFQSPEAEAATRPSNDTIFHATKITGQAGSRSPSWPLKDTLSGEQKPSPIMEHTPSEHGIHPEKQEFIESARVVPVLSASRPPRRQLHFVPMQRASKIHVYIGIDFGTAFTKASYSFAKNAQKSVRFNVTDSLFDATDTTPQEDRPYFRPSVVSYDASRHTLSYAYDPSALTIRYFKYQLLKPDFMTYNLNGILPEAEGIVCSVFFLACLIDEIKQQICKQEHLSVDQLDCHINMGVPFDNKNESGSRYQLFDQVLNSAFLLSSSHPKEMDVSQIKGFFDEAKETKNPNLQTFPELYAEILYFQNDSRFAEGYYMVVDVGGGTLDIALFSKQRNWDGLLSCSCISHQVLPLGVDSLVKEIALQGRIKETRAVLLREKGNAAGCISKGKLKNAGNRFYLAYGEKCIHKAVKIFGIDSFKRQKFLPCFLLGGGKKIHWYRNIINSSGNDMKTAGVPLTKILDLRRYLEESGKYTNDRLVIADMLAVQPDDIPELRGYPWRFIIPEKNPSEDVDDRLREIMDNRYGV